MREATSASLTDDGKSTGAGAGSVIFSGDVDDPRIEAGFRLGYGKDETLGDASVSMARQIRRQEPGP